MWSNVHFELHQAITMLELGKRRHAFCDGHNGMLNYQDFHVTHTRMLSRILSDNIHFAKCI